MIKTTTTSFVNIKATTWTQECKDLFDFESHHILEKNLEAHASASIFRVNNDIQAENSPSAQNQPAENPETIVYLKKDQDTFSVCRAPQNLEASPSATKTDKLWLVVKSVNPSNVHYKGQTLTEGDIIKLGKVKLRIRELRPFGYDSSSLNLKTQDVCPKFIQKHSVEKLQDGQEYTCKICLENEFNATNPLIAPCGCAGSVKHVHLECLKQWITSKCYHKADPACTMYMWKDLECELCHQSLPDIFLHENQEINLVDVVKPKTPYLILETMPENKDIRKVYYVATVTEDNKENVLRLGRKSDCHVKINDISVSRLHAMINLRDGKFLLENGFSKFGTLLLLRGEIPLHKEYNTLIQTGRTVLSFDLSTKEEIQIVPEPQQPVVEAALLSKECEDNVQRRGSDDSGEINLADNYKTNTSGFYLPVEDVTASVRKWSVGSYGESQIQKDIKHIDELLASMKELIQETNNQVNEHIVHLLENKEIYGGDNINLSPLKPLIDEINNSKEYCPEINRVDQI